jgi:hypothetical protein
LACISPDLPLGGDFSQPEAPSAYRGAGEAGLGRNGRKNKNYRRQFNREGKPMSDNKPEEIKPRGKPRQNETDNPGQE